MNPYPIELFLAHIRHDFIKQENRMIAMQHCSSDKEKKELRDKWDADDRTEQIADAIRDSARIIANRPRGLFGFF